MSADETSPNRPPHEERTGISRRTFLRGASIAVAAPVLGPVIVPATALGLGGRTAPSDRITVGCIGTGGQGRSNMRRFMRTDGFQVVAICDVDDEHLEKAKRDVDKQYGKKAPGGYYRGVDMYRQHEHVLDRDDIDAVSIGSPDHWHAIHAIHAARAGKDIYCEKPLSLTIREGRAIADAVERYGVVFQTGSWQRSRRDFRFACELVRNGRIGALKRVHVGLPPGKRGGSTKKIPVPDGFDYDRWLGPAPWVPYTEDRTHYDFRWSLDYSGGTPTDWGAHHCDIAQWGMGTERTGPVEIEGEGDFPTRGLWDAPDRFRFRCKYANGVEMIVTDKNRPNRQGVRFEGEDGWVFVSRSKLEAEPQSLLRSFIRHDELRLYRSHDHWENFLDCIKSRAETVTPAEIAHRSITIAHLGVIAMRLGRNVRWNPDAEQFVDDPEADRMLWRPMRHPWRI